MTYWILLLFNGLSFAMLIFIISSGLTLIFGLMDIINLSHGSFYLIGAYIGLSVFWQFESFWLAILVGVLAGGLIGYLMHEFFLRSFYGNHLAQVLLTFGFIFIFADLALWIWGGTPRSIPKPDIFSGSYLMGSIILPKYRVFIVLVGCIVALGLWLLQEKTMVGAMIRAGVDDPQMTEALGVNMKLIFTLVFVLGSMLAAFGGVIGGAFLGVYPGVDFEILLFALVVIIIGGVGSLKGAFIGSLLVGLINSFGTSLVPGLAMFLTYAPMAIILAFKPTGLFGKR